MDRRALAEGLVGIRRVFPGRVTPCSGAHASRECNAMNAQTETQAKKDLKARQVVVSKQLRESSTSLVDTCRFSSSCCSPILILPQWSINDASHPFAAWRRLNILRSIVRNQGQGEPRSSGLPSIGTTDADGRMLDAPSHQDCNNARRSGLRCRLHAPRTLF